MSLESRNRDKIKVLEPVESFRLALWFPECPMGKEELGFDCCDGEELYLNGTLSSRVNYASCAYCILQLVLFGIQTVNLGKLRQLDYLIAQALSRK